MITGRHRSLVVMVGLALICSTAWAETPGEHFRKAMEKKAEYCATHRIDPANRRCDILKLKPADPLATEEGRFAHSIKIPSPVPEDSGYKPGMTPEEYFQHLCKAEAGEFIYKTVENVEGIYMMRPRREAMDDELQHLYALEDPYGHTSDDDMPGIQDSYVQPALGKYQFIEIPLKGGSRGEDMPKFRRYYRDEKANPGEKYQTMINGRGVFVPYIVADAEVFNLEESLWLHMEGYQTTTRPRVRYRWQRVDNF